ncbi:hypothetical protein [Corynebacterium aquatimens]|uniref:Lipoprotein n=1 Tax=Corynebacterium aquatimens TaxID=1190508 RepID=A0A931GSS6_9CORY|nr:hypothetical protein [Corynebacterium aquatimens]MBG6122337.1 hypothetical protein [Corynebacterium aquatimens]WJY65120.1 hypothetical protein CAQUA_01935 [Corynebacterium aquatimens]
MRAHSTTVAIGAVATSVLLVGCSVFNEAQPADDTVYLSPVNPTDSEETTVSQTRAPDVPVDPNNYLVKGMSMVTFRVSSFTGTCAISAIGVSCTGTTPTDAPQVTAVPHPPKKADAVFVGDEGLHYTVFTGMPSANKQLIDGQSISVADHSCHYKDSDTFQCRSGEDSFTISGPRGVIKPSRKPDTPPMFTAADAY